MKRLMAALLALTVVLSLCACSDKSLSEALGDVLQDELKDRDDGPADVGGPSDSEGPAGGSGAEYFDHDIWRGDTDYSDMVYEQCHIQDFEAYTAPIYDFAENGGSQEDYDQADFELFNELYRIYTMYTIVSNGTYADASNDILAEEAIYAADVYSKARDEAMLALQALANSQNAELMESSYGDVLIAYIKSYTPNEDEEDELTARENELMAQYYSLMSSEEPDLDEVGRVFVELVNIRRRQAELAGAGSYADYAYGSFYGKDYSPEDAKVVWQGAKEYFSPLVLKYGSGIVDEADTLEEDKSFDCSVERVLEALGSAAGSLSGELTEAHRYLTDYHLYDIGPSAKKADEGFTVFLYYYNEPYIFNSASGTFYDYLDMMHEFGHFVSWYYCPSSLLFGIADNDLSELQAQGMEVAMSYRFGDLFGAQRGDVMADWALLDLALSIVDGAMYDEFQQRVYAEPDLTPEKVDEIYATLYEEYGFSPYDGYEREWMFVGHNFSNPFYYISYAVSALGALEINELMDADFDAGLDKYLTVLSMDPEVWYYSEAIEEAGLSDIFDIDSYGPIAEALGHALGDGAAA